MIGIVTDSASMLPPVWQDRAEVAVAPMTVVIDGVPRREGVEIGSAEFYALLDAGATVTTSAPSPGDLLMAYRAAVEDGASSIVAVHTGADYSAVLDAASIAVRSVGADVVVVDTGTVSFPVALCVAAAVDARNAGGDTSAVAAAARAAAQVVDSIFVVGVPELAHRGGRLQGSVAVPTSTTILTLGPAGLAEHGDARSIDDALEQMAAHVRSAAHGRPLRVGVGDADRPDLGAQLTSRLEGVEGIAELIRYEIGPSVGAHSGPGTVGAVWAPLPGE